MTINLVDVSFFTEFVYYVQTVEASVSLLFVSSNTRASKASGATAPATRKRYRLYYPTLFSDKLNQLR